MEYENLFIGALMCVSCESCECCDVNVLRPVLCPVLFRETIVHCEYCGSHDGDNVDRSRFQLKSTSEMKSKDYECSGRARCVRTIIFQLHLLSLVVDKFSVARVYTDCGAANPFSNRYYSYACKMFRIKIVL